VQDYKTRGQQPALLKICAKRKKTFPIADITILLRFIYQMPCPFIQLKHAVTTQSWLRNHRSLFLNCKVTIGSQPRRFISSVSTKNVATAIRLKIPRRNKHNVSNANPHSSLQFSTNSAQPFMPILTLHHHSVKTKQLNSYTQHVSASRQLNPPKIRFTKNFSLTQFSLHLRAQETALTDSDSTRKTMLFCAFVSGRADEPN
jgi:hypothetical protein